MADEQKMDPLAFAYWLHGWSEINGGTPPNAKQWQIINDHLDLVFNKVTPDRNKKDSAENGLVVSTPATVAPITPMTGLVYVPPLGSHISVTCLSNANTEKVEEKLPETTIQSGNNWGGMVSGSIYLTGTSLLWNGVTSYC